MILRGLTNLTVKPNVREAWLSLVSTQDIIGVKVCSAPGANSGTRPAVVAALVESMLAAGLPSSNIIVWDKQASDLRQAGYFDLAKRLNIRVEGAADAGYDEKVFYETPLLGQLVFGDRDFGNKGEGVGRKSYVSKLITTQITKIINVTPLLNHYRAGVTGNLYSLAIGSVDNTLRFEADAGRLAQAVPEIYALPEIGDRVVLNVVDALICQYQGEHRTLLHYATALNELRFSTDPVALDVLSQQDLQRQRQASGSFAATNRFELYPNASLLELGISDADAIRVERIE